MPPLVSVVIPTYNRLPLVTEAVQSVLSQTYSSFECIVVDDGSDDGTFERLRDAFGEKILLLRQENRGVSAARNLGMTRAQGEFVAFLDSDDLWKKEKLEKQMAWLLSHPEFFLCQTQEIWERGGRRVNPGKVHAKRQGDIFAASLERCLVTPSSVLIRRTLFDEVGTFDEALPACEDYDLWLRVACRYPVGLVDEALLIRRGGRPDQLSAQHSLDKYRIASLEKLIGSGVLAVEQRTLATAVFKRKGQIYGEGCLKRGKKDEGEAYLKRANKKGPDV